MALLHSRDHLAPFIFEPLAGLAEGLLTLQAAVTPPPLLALAAHNKVRVRHHHTAAVDVDHAVTPCPGNPAALRLSNSGFIRT